jgi:putative ABC transport system permease protein
VVRLPTLLYFYRKRLRVHAMQELLAGLGIATGVALVFAVQVANSSIVDSARQVLHGITGSATLQLTARDPRGFDQSLLRQARALPGVAHAAPLLEQRATVAYHGRRAPIDLLGVDASLPSLGGSTTSDELLGGFALTRGILLTSAVGHALGLPAGDSARIRVDVAVRGRVRTLPVVTVLGSATVGPVAGGMLGGVSLPVAQALTGLPTRITRIAVVPAAGDQALARRGLVRLSRGRYGVTSIDNETRLLDQATGPIDQATGLFAAISALVGLLFTFNAMLLTIPERRRFVADLRIMGYRPLRLVQILGFQAVMLGGVASALGLLAGYGLSHAAASDPPNYLAFAFPLGVEPVISPRTVALAFAGGVMATCLAAAQPLTDLRRSHAIGEVFRQEGEMGHALSRSARRRLAAAALALVAVTTAILIVAPALTILGVATLALATVLVVPMTFSLVLRVGDLAARFWRLNALVIASRALRATSIRSLALAATGAVAVFGSVAIEGAHRNLMSGLDRNFADYLGTADLWITAGGDENSLTTQGFELGDTLRRTRAVNGVKRAYPYYGGMLDIDGRRVWIIGRPTVDRSMIPPSQLERGDLATANRRLRRGGWIAVSDAIAAERHLALGEPIELPTPAGNRTFRLAATLTNLGWGPGAAIMSAADYRDAWLAPDPSALEVRLVRGHDVAEVRRMVQQAIDPRELALRVQTTEERDAQFRTLARQGLERLSQISTLLLIAAVLAMAAAMGAGIWQRRITFAQFRIMGWAPVKLWWTLLVETTLVLGTGCFTGAVAGSYGHLLGNRWLHLSTGYPAPFVLSTWQTVATCSLVALAAVVVTAVPGYFVSRAPIRLGLKASA